jgi:NAD dependent epimerase/dehydratase family enzyme
MRVVIPGGSGQVGQILARHMTGRGDEVDVLARGPVAVGRAVAWDGRTLGDWARVIDGADVVINLAGRSVNCRYTEANLREMLDSRVESTRAVGQAIAAARRPPRVWLQMSTATGSRSTSRSGRTPPATWWPLTDRKAFTPPRKWHRRARGSLAPGYPGEKPCAVGSPLRS